MLRSTLVGSFALVLLLSACGQTTVAVPSEGVLQTQVFEEGPKETIKRQLAVYDQNTRWFPPDMRDYYERRAKLEGYVSSIHGFGNRLNKYLETNMSAAGTCAMNYTAGDLAYFKALLEEFGVETNSVRRLWLIHQLAEDKFKDSQGIYMTRWDNTLRAQGF